jgi:hypothetical protein
MTTPVKLALEVQTAWVITQAQMQKLKNQLW